MTHKETFSEEFPLGRRFGLLMRMYFGALTKKLEKLDIDRHYSILILLENTKESYNQQDISDILKIDKASMVRITDYLVKKGYIERKVNPTDRREHRLCLTIKARKVLPRIHKAIDELNESALEGLNKKEAKIFWKNLDKVTKNLASEPAHTIIFNLKKIKTGGK
jgi:DNA-binding MarR family transcriptional regulator